MVPCHPVERPLTESSMEKRPAGKKPTAPQKPAAKPAEGGDTVINEDAGTDAAPKGKKASLDATEMFSQGDDADADAASMLLDDEPPARPTHKPAGKPRPTTPRQAQDTDDALAAHG